MNIQIFGTAKSNETKKAQRFFSERGIKFQFIDLRERQMSRGEFVSVFSAVGGFSVLFDENSKDKEAALIRYLTDDAKTEKLFENQLLIKLPVVRNGRLASVGYAPEIWKSWE